MPKNVYIEKSSDLLLIASGKAKVKEDYGVGNSRITNSPVSRLKLTFLDSKMNDEGDMYSEVCRIRIDPGELSRDFRRDVSTAISSREITNHFVSINQAQEKPSKGDIGRSSPEVTTFDIHTAFNYVAEDYDKLVNIVQPQNISWVGNQSKKNTYLHFKKEKKQAPIDYSLGAKKFENLVVPNAGPKVRKDLDASAVLEEYPYYNKISITNKVTNKFMDFVVKTSLFDSILNSYNKAKKTPIDFNVQVGQSVRQEKLQIFSLLDWVNSAEFSFPDNMRPLDPNSGDNSEMINNFRKLLFYGYVRELSKGSFRTFEDVVNNVQSYKEDFIYSLDKYEDVEAGPKAQCIYIPAVTNTSTYNDTQIKYGKKYIYKCNTHYIIVGNRYKYSGLKFYSFEGEKEYAEVTVVNRPSVVLVPIEMFTKQVVTLMSPPIFPQVKFVTENNSSNRIQAYLSPTKGSLEAPFILVETQDSQQISSMNHNSMKQGNKIKFKFENQLGLYEIYRSSSPPKSYTDFAGNKRAEKSMPYVTNSVIFNDFVKPNQKYYYMFRKKNVKGLVSNPTVVYEVELIQDADDSRVSVEEYEFPKPIIQKPTRAFKSLFQIYPTGQQTWFSLDQAPLFGKNSLKGTIDDLKLGVSDKSVWGRKFKIRIKSTTSGKIIDYNITFKLTKNKTEADF
jgi:hypothetical protein